MGSCPGGGEREGMGVEEKREGKGGGLKVWGQIAKERN